jgi:hypothetical protein
MNIKGLLVGLIALLTWSAMCVPANAFACEQAEACDKCQGSNASDAEMKHFWGLNDEMTAVYQTGDLVKAKSLAEEYLRLADRYPCDWNYGNALHEANTMLGLISMKSGDTDAAANYLLKAGKTPGSPQLDTFGPDMTLANALLQSGKTEVVKAYLKEIKSFWTMDYGAIDAWQAAIARGERPMMQGAAPPVPHIMVVLMALAPYLWTVFLVGIFFALRFKQIARKPLFLLVGGAVAFCAMFLGQLSSEYGSRYIISSSDSVVTVVVLWLLITAAVWLLPLLGLYITSRFFRMASPPIS